MDVDAVLESFERLLAIFAESADLSLCEKLRSAMNMYPFPELSRKQSWRKIQIESAIERRLILAKPPQ